MKLLPEFIKFKKADVWKIIFRSEAEFEKWCVKNFEKLLPRFYIWGIQPSIGDYPKVGTALRCDLHLHPKKDSTIDILLELKNHLPIKADIKQVKKYKKEWVKFTGNYRPNHFYLVYPDLFERKIVFQEIK